MTLGRRIGVQGFSLVKQVSAAHKAPYICSIWRGCVTMDPNRPVESSIRKKLTEELKPTYLDVINESHMHAHKGAERNFRVVVVSEKFDKLRLIQRHRLVNDALKEELAGPVHALMIVAKTPSQWDEENSVPKSPPCMGNRE